MDVRVVLCLLLSVIGGKSQTDKRCFLEGGWSTISFFVREDLDVNSVIGKIRAIGVVGQDISLKLAESQDVPVSIDVSDGSANLRLTAPLDKEGVHGPASLIVGVICERLGTNDPGFTIPINIRVTDVNDNAPVFIEAPYVLNISELSIIGSVIFTDVLAVDVDQPGPFSTVEYHIENGPYSDYVAFENPLEGKLILTKKLDYEKLQEFKLKVIAQDQGLPPRYNETSLIINVQDADDQNPAFYSDQYEAVIPEGSTEGLKLQVEPQDVRAFDKDLGINAPVYYTFSGSGSEYRYFELNRNTGQIYLKGQISENELTQPATLVIKATQFDNPDRYSVTTLTVSRGGVFSGDLSFVKKGYAASILENTPLNSVILTVITNRQSDRRVQYSIDYRDLPGKEFSISQKGDIVLRKSMDFETTEGYSFRVIVTDGWHNDSARVNISVININDWDPRFRYPQYEFFVSEEQTRAGHKVGTVHVYDGDKGDKITLDIRGAFARVFGITSKGDIVIRNLNFMNGTDAHIVVVAEDSGIPPRRASVPVVVKFAKGFAASRELRSDAPNWLMLGILSIVIVFSLLVIVSLGVYICKNKKRYKGNDHAENNNFPEMKDMANYMQQPFPSNTLTRDMNHQNRADANNAEFDLNRGANPMMGAVNPAYRGPDFIRPSSANSHRSNTASSNSTQNTNLTSNGPIYNPLNPRSGSRRYLKHKNGSNRVVPIVINQMPNPDINECGLPTNPKRTKGLPPYKLLPRSASTSDLTTNHASLQEELKRAILGSHNQLNRVEWPRASIPRRVKKLSWDDDLEHSTDRDISTYNYMDPNVSVTPMGEAPRSNGDVVYF